MKKILWVVTFVFMVCGIFVLPALNAEALDNGLAKTPPMGWNSWNIFHGNINETQIKQIADAMVSSGMRDAGYVYLNLDDNWMANPARDSNGNLRADPTRFPNGIKALADYVHSKGLKLGIYGCRGTMTCMNIPQSGSHGYEQRDANTFASWGIDYLKYDNCNIPNGSNMKTDYQKMQTALANCGRPIVYSICAWGYQDWMPATGNLWRTCGDITDKWDNGNDWFRGIINAIDDNAKYTNSAAPGAWNDPDMLEIGNGGCTTEEYRTQFSMWSIMASPLIAGNDIRTMSQTTKDILLNKEVIAVNQDAAGIQGSRVKSGNGLEVWCKPLGTKAGSTKAVALLNRNSSTASITVNWSDVGLTGSVWVRDLWAKADKGSFNGSYTASVPAHGTVMLKVSSSPISDSGQVSAFAKIEAENFDIQSGVQTETCTEGGLNVGYIENGDYTVYKNIDFGGGALSFQARVATSTQGGNIEVRLGGIDGKLVGTCPVGTTDGFQNWVDVSCKISGASGKHDLYLKFTGGSGYLFNVNWFQFTQSAFSRIEAESYSSLSSSTIEIADTPDGGKSLAYIENGNYALYGKVDFGSGAKLFKAKVASAGGTTIEIRLGSPSGTLIGTLPVVSTGGWNVYQEQSCNIDNVSGLKDVYIMFKGSVNLDCFSFAEEVGPDPVALGDLNSDGEINSVDFLLMKKHILELELLADPACADLDGSGEVNTLDLLLLKQYLLGIIDKFPG
ncbi:alpha-galactosidase [Anaerobacterium chartisolvens]|uniref:Alpha-galactosidase n=1 Tax=Anaerobacterium chartisolvens TaxID=1297424 RepID=A0A369B2Z3_9FIRM|nr:carbohydrate-binding protein [Anaerobacterium chartisolvens]RCX14816.1 alpha-galactosidase [Anaerobacterium chartisolvens]